MKLKNEMLYHIHRLNENDDMWKKGSTLEINYSFNALFYKKLLEEENYLIKKYGKDYDIDYIIAIMEEGKIRNIIDEENKDIFYSFLNNLYFLRRELALEEGRKIFNSNAPSRLHSIFLTKQSDIAYWKQQIGNNDYQLFYLEVNGNAFESSDLLYPNYEFMYKDQVELSKNYWIPNEKKLLRHKEIIFQGNAKITK